MKTNNTRCLGLLLMLFVGSAALVGCSQSPQDKYKDATDSLKQAKQSRQGAQQTLKNKQQALADARQDVNDAKSDLKSAKQKVAKAKQAVTKIATDDVLFRTIQRQLLNDDKFDNATISVRVQNRVVTLTGTVPDQDTHKKALQLARSQPGVKNVVDSLRLDQSNQNQNSNNKNKNSNHNNGNKNGG